MYFFSTLLHFIEKLVNGGKGHKFLKDVDIEIHSDNGICLVKPRDSVICCVDVDKLCSLIKNIHNTDNVSMDTSNGTVKVQRAVEITEAVGKSKYFCVLYMFKGFHFKL